MLNRHTYQIISSRGNTGETRKRLREQLQSVDRGTLVPAPGAEGGAKGKVAEPPGPPRGLQVFDRSFMVEGKGSRPFEDADSCSKTLDQAPWWSLRLRPAPEGRRPAPLGVPRTVYRTRMRPISVPTAVCWRRLRTYKRSYESLRGGRSGCEAPVGACTFGSSTHQRW